MRSLFIGRFQPYHLGHQAILEKIADETEEIIIIVGSAQESHTIENPFTAGERIEMIQMALKQSGLINRCLTIPLQDINRNSVWVAHIQSMTPRFDLVYSNNPLVIQLFSDAGIKTIRLPFYQRNYLSGTAIRKIMSEKGDWANLVPTGVASVIEEINGVERIINLSGTDMDHLTNF